MISTTVLYCDLFAVFLKISKSVYCIESLIAAKLCYCNVFHNDCQQCLQLGLQMYLTYELAIRCDTKCVFSVQYKADG